MIFTFWTPQGRFDVDSETVNDKQLADIGLTRDKFNRGISQDIRYKQEQMETQLKK